MLFSGEFERAVLRNMDRGRGGCGTMLAKV